MNRKQSARSCARTPGSLICLWAAPKSAPGRPTDSSLLVTRNSLISQSLVEAPGPRILDRETTRAVSVRPSRRATLLRLS